MTIKLYLNEKNKIMAKIGDKDYQAGEISLAVMLGKPEDVKRELGETKPDIEIEGSDPKLVDAKKEFDNLLEMFYNHNK